MGILLRRALPCTLLAVLGGCVASPPEIRGGGGEIPQESLRHPSVAVCSPETACPGQGCADHALGPPDGVGVSLVACPVLDLFFAQGYMAVGTGGGGASAPDLRIYLGPGISGRTRVEASTDGLFWVTAGFIGELPAGTSAECAIPVSAAAGAYSEALVHFGRCNTIANVAFVRLSIDRSTAPNLVVDALEALSLVVSGDPVS